MGLIQSGDDANADLNRIRTYYWIVQKFGGRRDSVHGSSFLLRALPSM